MDVAGLITGSAALIAALWGIVQYLRGERTKNRQEEAANRLADREQQFEEAQAAVETYRGLVGELRAEIARVNAARADEHQRHQLSLRDTREECSAARSRLAESLGALLGVVRDEIAQVAAQTALRRDEHHHHGED